jgi:hypothetical protein
MIKPFADNDAASSIGGLAIENGTDRVLLTGSIEITRDRAGLQRAMELKRLADDLVSELQGTSVDNAASKDVAAVDQVDNPFA